MRNYTPHIFLSTLVLSGCGTFDAVRNTIRFPVNTDQVTTTDLRERLSQNNSNPISKLKKDPMANLFTSPEERQEIKESVRLVYHDPFKKRSRHRSVNPLKVGVMTLREIYLDKLKPGDILYNVYMDLVDLASDLDDLRERLFHNWSVGGTANDEEIGVTIGIEEERPKPFYTNELTDMLDPYMTK